MKAPALVLAIPHKGGDSEDDGEAEDVQEDDSDGMEAFDTFADAMGIPDEKRQAAYDAFRAAVKAC